MTKEKLDHVLFFLRTPKPRQEIMTVFGMSNSESYHLLKWMEKGNFIMTQKRKVEGKTNYTWFYQSKKCYLPKHAEIIDHTSEVILCQTTSQTMIYT